MPKWSDWNIEYTKKGKLHMVRTRTIRLLAVTLAMMAAYRAHQNGVSLTDVKGVIRQMMQGSLARLLHVLTRAREQAVTVLKK
jgi:hypothetical protein